MFIFFRDYFIENNIEDVVSTKQTIKQLYEKINKSFSTPSSNRGKSMVFVYHIFQDSQELTQQT